MGGTFAAEAAVAVAITAVDERTTTIKVKERERAEGEQLMARHDELIAKGRAPHIVRMLVAKEFGEPHEWETIADRV